VPVFTGPNPAVGDGQVLFTDIPHIADQAGTGVFAAELENICALSAPVVIALVSRAGPEWAAASGARWATALAATGTPPRASMAARAMLLFMIRSISWTGW
jgi:hypothetical protein